MTHPSNFPWPINIFSNVYPTSTNLMLLIEIPTLTDSFSTIFRVLISYSFKEFEHFKFLIGNKNFEDNIFNDLSWFKLKSSESPSVYKHLLPLFFFACGLISITQPSKLPKPLKVFSNFYPTSPILILLIGILTLIALQHFVNSFRSLVGRNSSIPTEFLIDLSAFLMSLKLIVGFAFNW